MPLTDLVNESGNDEAILFLWLVSVSTDDCGHTGLTIRNGMVSLDCNIMCIVCFKQSHRNSQHCGQNTTARSQNTVAWRSNFEMLLTNDL